LSEDVSVTKYFDDSMLLEIARNEANMKDDDDDEEDEY
jgi:hypothetical protein